MKTEKEIRDFHEELLLALTVGNLTYKQTNMLMAFVVCTGWALDNAQSIVTIDEIRKDLKNVQQPGRDSLPNLN